MPILVEVEVCSTKIKLKLEVYLIKTIRTSLPTMHLVRCHRTKINNPIIFLAQTTKLPLLILDKILRIKLQHQFLVKTQQVNQRDYKITQPLLHQHLVNNLINLTKEPKLVVFSKIKIIRLLTTRIQEICLDKIRVNQLKEQIQLKDQACFQIMLIKPIKISKFNKMHPACSPTTNLTNQAPKISLTIISNLNLTPPICLIAISQINKTQQISPMPLYKLRLLS